jgi:hypothetical protein
LVLGNRKFDRFFDLLANEKVLNFNKSEEAHELVGQECNKSEEHEFSHTQR